MRGCDQGSSLVCRVVIRELLGDIESKWAGPAYIVNKMLMSKSQLQPVTIAAAAGGNKIAT